MSEVEKIKILSTEAVSLPKLLSDDLRAQNEFSELISQSLNLPGNLNNRIVILENDAKRYATKEDVLQAKIWGILTFSAAVISVLMAVLSGLLLFTRLLPFFS